MGAFCAPEAVEPDDTDEDLPGWLSKSIAAKEAEAKPKKARWPALGMYLLVNQRPQWLNLLLRDLENRTCLLFEAAEEATEEIVQDPDEHSPFVAKLLAEIRDSQIAAQDVFKFSDIPVTSRVTRT